MIFFPLVLSCGHYAHDNCHCLEKSKINYIDLALDQCKGKWRGILNSYGAALPAHKRAGACPVCGGKDRFTFDDKNGLGTWYCRGCEPHAGGGLILLARFIGRSTYDTAKELLTDGITTVAPIRDFAPVDYEAEKLKGYKEAKAKAAMMFKGVTTGQHQYLTDRGLDNAVRLIGDKICVPCYHDKELANIQLIGADKQKKFIYKGRVKGAYNVIQGNDQSIAIVEGYATGLTVNKLTGLRVFCCFMASNIPIISAKLREANPDKRLIIFADHDKDNVHSGWAGGAGLHYARQAASKTGALITHPLDRQDWDDTRQLLGDEKTLKMMKSQLTK